MPPTRDRHKFCKWTPADGSAVYSGFLKGQLTVKMKENIVILIFERVGTDKVLKGGAATID